MLLAALGALLFLKLAGDLHFHALDAQLPDGDEAGHLGAIELYRQVCLERGVVAAWLEAWQSPSEYPPLPAVANGFLLSLLPIDQPFPAGVELLSGLWMALTLLSVAWLAHTALHSLEPRSERTTGEFFVPLAAAAAYATFPLSAALHRTVMPESLLSFLVTLSLTLALHTRHFSRLFPSILLGGVLSLGLLSKQTFLLYMILPLGALTLVSIKHQKSRALLLIVLTLLIALPAPVTWFLSHLREQQGYGLSSLEVTWPGFLPTVAYYPTVLLGQGLGLVWAPFFLLALGTLLLKRRWALPLLLLLVLISLTLVPRKYPRLVVPALPAAAVLLAIGMHRLTQRPRIALASTGVLLATLQQSALLIPWRQVPESAGTFSPSFLSIVDPACPQIWIRRPTEDDLGLEFLTQELRKRASRSHPLPLGVIHEPSIPCSYETTFNYSYHLQEYSRRHGLELDPVVVLEANPALFRERLPELTLLVSTHAICDIPTPPEEGQEVLKRLCDSAQDWRQAGSFQARSERLSFTIFIYERVATKNEPPGSAKDDR